MSVVAFTLLDDPAVVVMMRPHHFVPRSG